ncbi:hypothetical protein BDP27DRAFT_1433612 [Rhodocollybia butyracea]|uniref:Uncharacterized protein n=1 Tax=Rhodocollybia butyracea TaxID=206335 RepID=A0A9P5P7M9_9AGAR|nr:hypothetical protein BDP27DRAFT_1433612 [Rhodocollybia butyracea]
MSAINPALARTMTSVRRTFSKDSFASVKSSSPMPTPASKSKPKAKDLLAERSQLETNLEKAANDYEVSEKRRADAEQREVSEALRTEKDNALKDAEALRKTAREAEERAEASRKALEAVEKAEVLRRAALESEERAEASRRSALEFEGGQRKQR